MKLLIKLMIIRILNLKQENKKTDLTEYYNLLYQYKIDCLVAGIEYNKKYYSDGGLRPEESIFFQSL